MKNRIRPLIAAAAVLLALGTALAGTAEKASAAESLSVNLASVTGSATSVGEGFLYGVSQDGTQPSDQNLQPLGITAFRGGGHVSRGWIGDGYQNGSGTQADVNTVIAQARRLTQGSYHAQYQVILSDIFGADGGQPSNTTYPCTSGNCSNWVTFVGDMVSELQATGLPFAYDIWNEPDISVFWPGGAQTSQYYQMWQSAYKEIRSVAPNATIVGPDFAFTPQQNQGEWQGFLSNAKSSGTVPTEITNHEEGDGDDPVADSNAIENDISAAGISPAPRLSANEYQPADRQTTGVTAWYLARFAQSRYFNAMRGNWVCCLTPNLAGVLTSVNGSFQPNGNWWAMRAYADMTGSLVSTSGQTGSTAISAAEDSSAKRSVAIVGDDNGFTGAASVTYSGLASVPWLASNGSVNVTVERIPDQYPLSAPQVVENQNVSVSSGSITVPLTFQAAHDAFAIYLTPATSSGGGFPSGYHRLVIGNDSLCLDVTGNVVDGGCGDRPVDLQRPVQPAVPVRGRAPAATARCRRRTPAMTSRSPAAPPRPARPTSPRSRPVPRRAASGCRCGSPTARGSSRTPPAACAWTSPAPAAPSASSSTSGRARTPPAPTRTSPPAET